MRYYSERSVPLQSGLITVVGDSHTKLALYPRTVPLLPTELHSNYIHTPSSQFVKEKNSLQEAAAWLLETRTKSITVAT